MFCGTDLYAFMFFLEPRNSCMKYTIMGETASCFLNVLINALIRCNVGKIVSSLDEKKKYITEIKTQRNNRQSADKLKLFSFCLAEQIELVYSNVFFLTYRLNS